MLGIILCTHSELASGLKKAIEMIAGEQENFDAVCFMNGDDIEELREKLYNIAEKYRKINMQYCYIVDLLGATPFNVALLASADKNSIIITGANLPLLLEILMSREQFDGNDCTAFLESALNSVKESMQVIDTKVLFSEE